jgi:hypothetical protein
VSLFSLIRFKPLNHYIQITLHRGREKTENRAAHKRCEYTVQGRCNLQPLPKSFSKVRATAGGMRYTLHITIHCNVLTLHVPSSKQCTNTRSSNIKPNNLREYTMKFERPGPPTCGDPGVQNVFRNMQTTHITCSERVAVLTLPENKQTNLRSLPCKGKKF